MYSARAQMNFRHRDRVVVNCFVRIFFDVVHVELICIQLRYSYLIQSAEQIRTVRSTYSAVHRMKLLLSFQETMFALWNQIIAQPAPGLQITFCEEFTFIGHRMAFHQRCSAAKNLWKTALYQLAATPSRIRTHQRNGWSGTEIGKGTMSFKSAVDQPQKFFRKHFAGANRIQTAGVVHL